MKLVALGAVAELNPPKPKGLQPEQTCSFVPMEAVDDILGVIASPVERLIGEVGQGYTYFANDDVLFAKITPCMENGKCAIARNLVNGIGFGSTEFHVARAHEDVIPEWIYYFLRQEKVRREAMRHMTGSAGQQRVPAAFLREVQIPLPPLAEQQRIAGLLRRADRLRRLRRYALDVSAGYLQAVFVEMFGDESEHQAAELEDLLREDPKNGLYLDSEKYGKGTPIIRINNFYDGVLNSDTEFKRVQASQRQISEFCVTTGDILINRVNSIEYLGKCALVERLREQTLYESNMMRVRVDLGRIVPQYLARYLSSQQAREQIRQLARKSVNQASINQSDVKSLRIVLPGIDLQWRYEGVVRKFRGLENQQQEALRQAEHLFQALLRRAFAG